MLFEVAGIEVQPWIPPLVSFVLSFFTSMGGVSGAFLLLPFQMSALGYVNPVSSTNQFYNIVAIPSGVWRFIREGRMVWPLTWIVIVGTLPGVLIGAIVRALPARRAKFPSSSRPACCCTRHAHGSRPHSPAARQGGRRSQGRRTPLPGAGGAFPRGGPRARPGRTPWCGCRCFCASRTNSMARTYEVPTWYFPGRRHRGL